MTDYPNDDDGDALRRIAESGSDMSQPMLVDFFIAVHDEQMARAVADAVGPKGYAIELDHDDEDDDWSCCCSREMLLTHDAVVAAQAELQRLAEPLGGEVDGWGTFGNTDDDADEDA